MKTTKMKLAGFFMGVFLMILAFPVSAKADTVRIQCGDNVYGSLEENGTLTISGSGDMWDSDSQGFFWDYRTKIYKVIVQDGVTSIGDNAFNFAYINLSEVSIGKTVNSIGDYAFRWLSHLYNIEIPGNVETIGTEAFRDSGLNKCTLNRGLRTIGDGAFCGTNLKAVSIPDGISIIGDAAFYGCNSLESVTIPEHIDIIKANAFPKVTATIYSRNVLIGPNAFGKYSVFKIYRGSYADRYAKDYYDYHIDVKYIPITSTVTFNPNGGKVEEKSKSVKSEICYGELPIPTRRGYTFTGWYTAKTGGSKIGKDTLVTAQNNHTLYSHWEKVKVADCKSPKVKNLYSKKISVTIPKVKGAAGYQVRYAKNSRMTGSKCKAGASRKKTISGLKKGKKYYVQVRAFKKDSLGKKVYGEWSPKVSVKIKK